LRTIVGGVPVSPVTMLNPACETWLRMTFRASVASSAIWLRASLWRLVVMAAK